MAPHPHCDTRRRREPATMTPYLIIIVVWALLELVILKMIKIYDPDLMQG